MEKLDLQSKILVATGAINYLSNSIFTLNEQIRTIANKSSEKFLLEEIEKREEILVESVKQFGVIMENLGNCLNDCDGVCEIDSRITEEAFKIIVLGKDKIN